jgi:hypothetical protein
MSKMVAVALVAVLAVAAAFGAGYFILGNNGLHPAIYTADRCDVVETGGSCFVGGTGYGFDYPPTWTDNFGVFHQTGWPACLPPMSSVKGLGIAADWLYVGPGAQTYVFWVDCENHY